VFAVRDRARPTRLPCVCFTASLRLLQASDSRKHCDVIIAGIDALTSHQSNHQLAALQKACVSTKMKL
jgi:hypothetical protein